MTLSRSALIALAAVAMACASEKPARGPGAAPAAAADSVARYYPLAVGNEWTYEVSAPGGQRKRDTIRIVKREGNWFVDDHKGRLLLDPEGLRDADRYLLRGPVKAGAKWSAVEDLVVHRFEIVATDASEVTPAGTFLHCVTVRNEQPLGQGQRGKFVTEWSYAPGVGLVRMRTTVEDGQKVLPMTSLALVEFRVQ